MLIVTLTSMPDELTFVKVLELERVPFATLHEPVPPPPLDAGQVLLPALG
jgi:hypothetical protein